MPSPTLRITLVAVVICAALPSGAMPTATRKGLVIAAHPLAARAGAQILKEGGTAVDALVATAFALSVVEPHSSGLGGGGFALIYRASDKSLHALDFREVAPGSSRLEDYFKNGKYDDGLSRFGGKSIAVPGAVAGYCAVAKRFGSLPLPTIMKSAIQLARDGFILGPWHQRGLDAATGMRILQPATARHFSAGTEVLGTVLKQPALTKLLQELALFGPEAFYRGRHAEAIAMAVQAAGGVLAPSDLANYEVRDLEPIHMPFRGRDVVSLPLPSAGGVTVLATLGVLDRLPPAPPGSNRNVDMLHAMVETWNRAYSARAEFMGDPRLEHDAAAAMRRLLAPASLDAWAKGVGPKATPHEQIGKHSAEIKEGPETTHISVVDRAGNVAIMTTTINGPFGSGVLVPELGIVLNNELDDFAAPEGSNLYGLVGGKFNLIKPGKTPLSSMSPTIVFDHGKPVLAVGAPGGATIATTVVQVIVHVLDEGMDIQQAITAPRIHAQFEPDNVKVEPFGMEEATRGALFARGHRLFTSEHNWGNAMGFTIAADGLRKGSADPRGGGAAIAEDQLEGW